MYADETANAERGHVYSQNQYDTIFPAFNLGREFAISFWARFTSAPATVADDSTQYVFYKENVSAKSRLRIRKMSNFFLWNKASQLLLSIYIFALYW